MLVCFEIWQIGGHDDFEIDRSCAESTTLVNIFWYKEVDAGVIVFQRSGEEKGGQLTISRRNPAEKQAYLLVTRACLAIAQNAVPTN